MEAGEDQSSIAARARSLASRRGDQAVDLVLAGFVYVTSTLAFSAWYSERLFDRDAFTSYYRHGVYRPRVLGRELVLLVDRLLPGNVLGDHLVLNGRHPHAGALFTAIFVVNGVALLVVVVVVRRWVDRARIDRALALLVVVTLLVVLGASSSTVTPYDFPSYALIAVVLAASGAGGLRKLAAVPLVVLAVLTRESALVAVAALVACWWTERAGASASPEGERPRFPSAVAIAAGLTYVGIRLVVGGPPWAALSVRGNVGRLYGLIGLSLMVAAYAVWRHVCSLTGLDQLPVRSSIRWLWIFALPYVATSLLTGYWFELRLLVPMLIAELWLRTREPVTCSASPT